jgi:hypothetical protein
MEQFLEKALEEFQQYLDKTVNRISKNRSISREEAVQRYFDIVRPKAKIVCNIFEHAVFTKNVEKTLEDRKNDLLAKLKEQG